MPQRWGSAIGVLILFSITSISAGVRKPAGRPAANSEPASRSTTSTQPARLPIPSSSDQEKSLHLIRQVFASEYADRTESGRQSLGRKLLSQALQTQDDLIGRYVLLNESAGLSAGIADLSTAMRAIETLSGEFEISQLALQRSALRTASVTARGARLVSLANACLRTIDLAVAEDQYDQALELAAMAESAAMRSKNLPLVKQVQQRQKELLLVRNQFERIRPILTRANPDITDPAERSAAGLFLCAVKGDWDRGLPLLVGGSDPAGRKAAEADLADPSEPTIQSQVGHGWWELAPAEPWLVRRNFRRRAALWYRRSHAHLAGFSRSLVDQRLMEVDQDEILRHGLLPGLKTELFADESFARCLKTRIDDRIDYDFGTDAPDPLLPRDHFSIRWNGLLHPPAAGRYTIIITANTGARLWLNDKLLLDAPDLTHLRKGSAVMVELPEGFHPLRLEFWDGGGTARIKLSWIPPNNGREQPIPADAFFHEPEE